MPAGVTYLNDTAWTQVCSGVTALSVYPRHHLVVYFGAAAPAASAPGVVLQGGKLHQIDNITGLGGGMWARSLGPRGSAVISASGGTLYPGVTYPAETPVNMGGNGDVGPINPNGDTALSGWGGGMGPYVPASPGSGGGGGGSGSTPWAGTVGLDGFIYTATAPIGATPDPLTDALVLQSPGFNASGLPTTRTRTIPFLGYGRQFYPNGGTNVTTQAVLSKRVFAGEAGGASVTNSSAKTDRAPFIGFLTPSHRWLTSPSLTIDAFVDHWHAMDGKPVAAVRGAVKDSAGTVFYGPWVSAEIAVTSAASGLSVPVYRLPVDFTGAVAGLLWSYVQVAPNIGTAIYDQLAANPTDEANSGNLPQRHYYDATDTLRRYVTLGGADDTPKGVGTTAGTAPAYLTVNGAAAALDVAMTDLGLGGVILLPDGVTANMTTGLNSRATNAFGIQINGVGPLYNGVITTGADSADYVFEKAIWNRVTIDGTGAGRVFSNRATTAWDHYQTFYKVALVNCPVAATDYFQSCGRCYFWECTSDSPDGFTGDVQGNIVVMSAYLSSKIGGNSTVHAIGCKINTDFSPNVGQLIKAPICAYNLMHAAGGANNVKLDSFLSGQDGFCVVGNVMAHTGATNDDNMELEGLAPEEFYNAIIAHNTCVGGSSNGSRSNQSNEEGDFSLCHEMKVVSCIFDARVKHGDYDNLGAATTPGSRRRNHPVRWGVDEAHNVTHRLSGAAVYGFGANDGERSALYSIDPTTRLSFADDRTARGTNNATITAHGDYRLVAASIPVNLPRPVGASVHHAFDLQGVAIPINGTALPGALQTTA